MSPDTKPTTSLPTVIVNGYCKRFDPLHPNEPGYNNMLVALVVIELVRNHQAQRIVFLANHADDFEKSIAKQTMLQVLKMLQIEGIPCATPLRVMPYANSTIEEVAEAHRIFPDKPLMFLGIEDHMHRIETDARREFGRRALATHQVTVISAESIIREAQTPQNDYERLLELERKDPDRETFRRRERWYNMVNDLPHGEIPMEILQPLQKFLAPLLLRWLKRNSEPNTSRQKAEFKYKDNS